MNHLHCGGAEKALVSLLRTIDYSKYKVDLLLFKREGMFLDHLPNEVKLLDPPSDYRYFDMSMTRALLECLKSRKLGLAIARLKAGMIIKIERNPARREQLVWRQLTRALPFIHTNYDAAIGYLEKNPVYYCIEKVEAKVKLGFIHNDYVMLGMDPKLDHRHFQRLDYLVTVSEECASVLKRTFPMYSNKVRVIHNIVSPSAISQLSLLPKPLLPKKGGITIISVGRLTAQKGFDMAIEACRILINYGYDVRWYVVGEGKDRRKLEEQIQREQLQERFLLLGLEDNPYPLIRQADLYVQTSRFEGKSIAIDEAKILGKPIVVTNFSTATDQITHEHNGLIVEQNAQAIALGVERLIVDQSLSERFVKCLANEELGTEEEIDKLYSFLA